MTVRAAVAPQKDHRLEIAEGEYVFREGDLGTEMFIVHEGQVEITKRIGGEEKQLALLEKGDFFGEMSLLEELPRVWAMLPRRSFDSDHEEKLADIVAALEAHGKRTGESLPPLR